MSRTHRQKSQQWEMLLEQVSGKLEQVKLALAAIQAKELDLEEKEGKILTLKKQYSSNLVDLERVDHDIEEATRLRKFMIHLDKTLSLIKREARGVQNEKAQIGEEFVKLEKERLKFETLKQRAEDKNELEAVRKENRERDLSNSLRHSKT
ncbi:MAG: hypothetical protein CMP88_10885 [Gammaproteobacteria bacterium]|nr:hypothetical protein [Gammaproteobacteria bacterium]